MINGVKGQNCENCPQQNLSLVRNKNLIIVTRSSEKRDCYAVQSLTLINGASV